MSILETRRPQMFPTLSREEIDRLRHFGATAALPHRRATGHDG